MENLYEADFYSWTRQQLKLLKQGDFDSIDRKNLSSALAALGGEYVHELKKRLTVLLVDLLVWQYKFDLRCHSWRAGIGTQRLDITRLLDDNPSLTNLLPELFDQAYEDAIYEAAIRTGYWWDEFTAGIWSFEDVMKEDFWPERWPEAIGQEK